MKKISFLFASILITGLSIGLMALSPPKSEPYKPIIKDVVINFSNANGIPFEAFNIFPFGFPDINVSYGTPIKVKALLKSPYYSNFTFYVEKGVDTRQCMDHDHLDDLHPTSASSVFVRNVDTNKTGIIWCQIVSQCHFTISGSQYPSSGIWWKDEKMYSPGAYPLTPSDGNNNFKFAFMNVTSCTLPNGEAKEYGCGTDDLH